MWAFKELTRDNQERLTAALCKEKAARILLEETERQQDQEQKGARFNRIILMLQARHQKYQAEVKAVAEEAKLLQQLRAEYPPDCSICSGDGQVSSGPVKDLCGICGGSGFSDGSKSEVEPPLVVEELPTLSFVD